MAKEDTKKAEAPETATAQPTAPAPDPMALSIGDLKNLSTVLDVASTRGAFRAGEMANVGFLYNKLQTFFFFFYQQTKPLEAPTAEVKK